MVINTGTSRSIVGHAISGAIIGGMLSGIYEFSQYKQGNTSKNKALKSTLKATLEGGIITASGIAATNALGNTSKNPLRNTLEATACIALGLASVYGISQLINTKLTSQKEK
ncbi:hypothetical protein [Helicobacter apodemus]|uniref:Uncharacterized protein n=1 Tax=Helicobacter apodemus TaxID=135569 RepID=A0A2U8FD50_9HELI|nr:hypothetical protein [Helicobacter apodemus]AWI34066.1 hypothetical protein CDV25_04230 [Helicobacter apodemus]